MAISTFPDLILEPLKTFPTPWSLFFVGFCNWYSCQFLASPFLDACPSFCSLLRSSIKKIRLSSCPNDHAQFQGFTSFYVSLTLKTPKWIVTMMVFFSCIWNIVEIPSRIMDTVSHRWQIRAAKLQKVNTYLKQVHSRMGRARNNRSASEIL